MKITKSVFLAIIFLLSLVFISCNTLPKDIDEEVGPEDMIIKAQQYSDEGKTRAAEIMYNRLLDQYGSDTNYRIIAEFEIAHIKLKAHKYAEAKPLYEDIINIYDSTYESLPGKYLVLAKNDLARLNSEYKYDGDKKNKKLSKKEKAKQQQQEEEEENSAAFW
ncbi:MAG: hypothetical protein J6V73_01785 [Spirochaetaceae bacterium]|nr:hypothetical protein [Spirochaetaceae bacterium]MBP5602030.1 hypothetical protein [Treponema sp.]